MLLLALFVKNIKTYVSSVVLNTSRHKVLLCFMIQKVGTEPTVGELAIFAMGAWYL